MIRTSSNLGVKLGALVAATGLMLAGGAAVASAAYADNNGQGQGSGPTNSQKPDKDPNPNKPDKGDQGNTDPGNPNPGKDGKPGNPTEPGKKVWICHADANNGKGQTDLGQGAGGGEYAKGFNVIEIAEVAWLQNHDRLHEDDQGPFSSQAQAEAACFGVAPQVTKCAAKAGGTYGSVTFTGAKGQTAADLSGSWTASTGGTYADYTVDASKCGEPVPATMEAQLCAVNGDAYVLKTESVTDTAPDAATAEADATAELVEVLNGIAAANPKSIIKPFAGFSHNWTPAGQAIFNAGCVLPDGETVASVNLAAPATVPASGKPAPAKVPSAGKPLPAAVPAGDGSTAPGLPAWALAMVLVGALGAAASGLSLGFGRKE